MDRGLLAQLWGLQEYPVFDFYEGWGGFAVALAAMLMLPALCAFHLQKSLRSAAAMSGVQLAVTRRAGRAGGSRRLKGGLDHSDASEDDGKADYL